ncbi:hypothetical protein Hdeb2414_s0016g00477801 [Helianthus debilis subsp. tardiflorus]
MEQRKNERCYVHLYNHVKYDVGRRRKSNMPELCIRRRSGISPNNNGRQSEECI